VFISISIVFPAEGVLAVLSPSCLSANPFKLLISLCLLQVSVAFLSYSMLLNELPYANHTELLSLHTFI
jgi:hypothetical protein